MKNYYSTLDNIVLTFSNIEEKNGFEEITVHFERANDGGFGFAEGKLPEKRQVLQLPKTLFMGKS